MTQAIPFNKPHVAGREMFYMAQAVLGGHSSGDGPFTKQCHQFLEEKFQTKKALLTHSFASALDMAAMLCGVGPGDEVILPSFAYVSTANAFYMRGAKPVFVDIRPDTLNIDETKIEQAITDRTKVIVASHYCGVGCDMETICALAKKHGLLVVEDAGNGFATRYGDSYLGTMGDLGTFSFHETSNIMCGEGGAILVNNAELVEQAEIIWEKGTNRSKFYRGEVDKYTWVSLGSSFLPSDLIAAYLYAQLENLDEIIGKRERIFAAYYDGLEKLAHEGFIQLPYVTENPGQRSHFFYILLTDRQTRDGLIDHLKHEGILAAIHFVPLHLSPMGKSLGYQEGDLPVTEDVSSRLVRLPFYYKIRDDEQKILMEKIIHFMINYIINHKFINK